MYSIQVKECRCRTISQLPKCQTQLVWRHHGNWVHPILSVNDFWRHRSRLKRPFAVMVVLSINRVWLFCDPMDCNRAPLSMGFLRQEYWSGLPVPPGHMPNSGIELSSSALADKFFTTEPKLESRPYMDCRPPDSSVHGIFQAGILEWIAISFSRGCSLPRDLMQVFCIAGRFFTFWASSLSH